MWLAMTAMGEIKSGAGGAAKNPMWLEESAWG